MAQRSAETSGSTTDIHFEAFAEGFSQVLESTDSLLAMLDSANSELAMVQISRGYNQIVETT
jgi:hypothetical protein